MKSFKQILNESNSDYFNQFSHPDDHDDHDDGDSHDQEERAVTAAHRIMSEETQKMHQSPIPFRYDTISGSNRRLTFKTLHDAMGNHTSARIAQLAAHGFLVPNIPEDQQERAAQIMQRINDNHSHLLEEMMKKSIERSRELYRTNSHFKLAMDKLKSYYDVDHDEMYKREFEDRLNEDHVLPHTLSAATILRSSEGEGFRQDLATKLNQAIMKHGGSIGVIIDNPVSPRRRPRVEHL